MNKFQRIIEIVFGVALIALAVLLAMLWSYFFIRKKNQKLTEARETIAGQLEMLQQANRQLKEDGKMAMNWEEIDDKWYMQVDTNEYEEIEWYKNYDINGYEYWTLMTAGSFALPD